MISAGERSART